MLVQNQSVNSGEILVSGVSSDKFDFNSFFRMEGKDGTNVSRVSGDFHQSFQRRSRRQCEMPKSIKFIHVPYGHEDTLDTYLKEAGSLKDFRELRVPIKLVGHLKEVQKHGQPGHLMVCGVSNIFLCRDSSSNLRLVNMKFVRTDFPIDSDGVDPNRASWEISSSLFNSDQKIAGPLRILIACR